MNTPRGTSTSGLESVNPIDEHDTSLELRERAIDNLDCEIAEKERELRERDLAFADCKISAD